jgi:hypothetical protein
MNDYLFSYCGQERNARKLLINEKLASVDEVAVMSSDEVESLIKKHYEVISNYGEEVILVKKDDMDKFKKIVKYLYR